MEYYCAYQERCHKEVVKKLQELGMINMAINTIVSKLIEDNYLNETRFAQSYVRGKFRIKKWGKIRIRKELKARDLSDYNIKKGLEEIPDLDYNNTFWALFEKRKKEAIWSTGAGNWKRFMKPYNKFKLKSFLIAHFLET